MNVVDDEPLVRVVVLDYHGGQMTLDCLGSLVATDWPSERLEIVLVDNGGDAGLMAEVRARFPQVVVIEPGENLGFAAGCNRGIRAPGRFDAVALVNNDAEVAPGWLRPLVEALQSDARVGAVCPKILFDGQYQELVVEVPDAAPVGGDPRRLGVRVTAVRLDGVRADERLTTDEGFHAPDTPDAGEEMARWSGRRGSLRIRATGGEPVRRVSVRLTAPSRRRVRLEGAGSALDLIADTTPRWYDVEVTPIARDAINNVGSCLFAGGYGGDRGFLELDAGQYDAPAEVFAWCGGAVLLSNRYLDEVGLFDERLFLYYEDTELSWRGRLSGWCYVYEPASVVWHRHSASSGGVGSPVFSYYTDRNRLVVLMRHAPNATAARALAVRARRTASLIVGQGVRPLLRGRRPAVGALRHEARVWWGIARLAPAMLRERRAVGEPDRLEQLRWETLKTGMA